MEAVHLRVSGCVQGVGYRAWAVRTAARLGVRGWVRNRSGGTVEALIIGDAPSLAAMVEACRQGPRAATVEHVAISEAEDDGSADFAARPTL
jgi:acylphosphatase